MSKFHKNQLNTFNHTVQNENNKNINNTNNLESNPQPKNNHKNTIHQNDNSNLNNSLEEQIDNINPFLNIQQKKILDPTQKPQGNDPYKDRLEHLLRKYKKSKTVKTPLKQYIQIEQEKLQSQQKEQQLPQLQQNNNKHNYINLIDDIQFNQQQQQNNISRNVFAQSDTLETSKKKKQQQQRLLISSQNFNTHTSNQNIRNSFQQQSQDLKQQQRQSLNILENSNQKLQNIQSEYFRNQSISETNNNNVLPAIQQPEFYTKNKIKYPTIQKFKQNSNNNTIIHPDQPQQVFVLDKIPQEQPRRKHFSENSYQTKKRQQLINNIKNIPKQNPQYIEQYQQQQQQQIDSNYATTTNNMNDLNILSQQILPASNPKKHTILKQLNNENFDQYLKINQILKQNQNPLQQQKTQARNYRAFSQQNYPNPQSNNNNSINQQTQQQQLQQNQQEIKSHQYQKSKKLDDQYTIFYKSHKIPSPEKHYQNAQTSNLLRNSINYNKNPSKNNSNSKNKIIFEEFSSLSNEIQQIKQNFKDSKAEIQQLAQNILKEQQNRKSPHKSRESLQHQQQIIKSNLPTIRQNQQPQQYMEPQSVPVTKRDNNESPLKSIQKKPQKKLEFYQQSKKQTSTQINNRYRQSQNETLKQVTKSLQDNPEKPINIQLSNQQQQRLSNFQKLQSTILQHCKEAPSKFFCSLEFCKLSTKEKKLDPNYLKIFLYKDFMNIILYSNRLFLPYNTHHHSTTHFKAYVGKGNNCSLVKSVISRNRWWWNIVQDNDKDKEDINLYWSQTKKKDYYNIMKIYDQILHHKKQPKLIQNNSINDNQNSKNSQYNNLLDIQDQQKIKDYQSFKKLKKLYHSTHLNTTLKHDFIFDTDQDLQIFNPQQSPKKKKTQETQEEEQQEIQQQQNIETDKNQEYYNTTPLQQENQEQEDNIEQEEEEEILYSEIQDPITPQHLKMHNHLSNNYHLSNKKALLYNMTNYYNITKKDPFDYLPKTYHIKSQDQDDPEFQRFCSVFDQQQQEIQQQIQNQAKKPSKNIWIIKPGESTNRGHGIQVSDNLTQIKQIIFNPEKQKKGRTYILQKYLDKPFLYNKRKFDIRCYFFITSYNNIIKGYWYPEGYIRTSCREFTLKNLDNRSIHLTNDFVQKKQEDYGKFENGNKLSFTDFQKYLEQQQQNISFMNEIYPQMKNITTHCIQAVYSKIHASQKSFCFELFGLDFMIDEQFKVWLIEVNNNPDLATSSPLLSRIIPQMLDNVFRIAVDPVFSPPYWPKSKKNLIPENIFQNNKFELIFDYQYDDYILNSQFPGFKQAVSIQEIEGLDEDQANREEQDEIIPDDEEQAAQQQQLQQ